MALTVFNGQIYTPGLAIIDAPQPNTPLGGDTLQVAIDISGNGQLPPNSDSTKFHSINLFLTSEKLSKNFTISNGTNTSSTAYVGPILDLEPTSTVKHVDWTWPDCLVGDGDSGSARGDYNVSIHQLFRWNGTDYFTVSDLPISVTNSISESDDRVDCLLLENELLEPAAIAASNGSLPGQPWVNVGVDSKTESNDGVRFKGTGLWALVAMVVGGLVMG
ncbi:hypothetical protein BDV25DRAFT_167822 [Aspergillus avenaceus]|uniref:Uncharacterized protein n=1 Tax=Aspergillus avenaceus TaxID=36643 RepID=A0A5N6U7P2_ASPAV|nr:hypothetical protein BDV25DRAFT_167822 [Aspergillus avenaceus]